MTSIAPLLTKLEKEKIKDETEAGKALATIQKHIQENYENTAPLLALLNEKKYKELKAALKTQKKKPGKETSSWMIFFVLIAVIAVVWIIVSMLRAS